MNDCHQAQLNLFTKTPSDKSLKSKEWIEYKPTNQINDTSAINFSITAQSSAYVDLKSSVLNVKLTNGDGTPMNEAIVAGLVNTPFTLYIPEAGETAEAPVKRYCNTG